MNNDVLIALKTIAEFPITDPSNQDAVNMRNIAAKVLDDYNIPTKEEWENSDDNLV